jgi:hypothetical protein
MASCDETLFRRVPVWSRAHRWRWVDDILISPRHDLGAALGAALPRGRRGGRRAFSARRRIFGDDVPVAGTKGEDRDAEQQQQCNRDSAHERSAGGIVALAQDVGAVSVVGIVSHRVVLRAGTTPGKRLTLSVVPSRQQCTARQVIGTSCFPRAENERRGKILSAFALRPCSCESIDLSAVVAAGNPAEAHAQRFCRQHLLQRPQLVARKLVVVVEQRCKQLGRELRQAREEALH